MCGCVKKSIYFSITWFLIEIPNSGLGVETGYTQKYLVLLPEITVRNSISLKRSRSISVASFSVRNISFGSVQLMQLTQLRSERCSSEVRMSSYLAG